MHFVTRDFLCERLRLKSRASYGLVRSSRLALISSDEILGLLNNARRSGQKELTFIPSDIVTAEEAERETGVSAARLKRWARRRVKCPPHFRINKQTMRFSLSALTDWLARMTRA